MQDTTKGSGLGHRCYVGVDLRSRKREVVAVALYEETIRDAYVLSAHFSGDGDGLILVDRDDSYLGREAISIATASRNVGLGWTFQVAR